MLVGSCARCGRPANLRCVMCGRTYCRDCLDEDERFCPECLKIRSPPKGTGSGPPGRRLGRV